VKPHRRDPPSYLYNFRTGRGLTLLPIGWGAMLILHSLGAKGFGITETILGAVMLIAGILLFAFYYDIIDSV
jgi:hypothetical protein